MKRLAFVLALLASAPSALAAATSGVVFSGDGDPVGGARVVARRAETAAERRTRIVAGIEPVVLASAITADDGSFTLDAKVGGVLELFVERVGHAPAMKRVLSGENDVLIEVEPAASRRGHVTAGGKAVAGALVLAKSGREVVWSTRTDEQGAYTIAAPRGWCSGLFVIHPDYAPRVVDAKEGGDLSIDVALDAGRVVSGTVVGTGGRPAQKARVIAGLWQEATTAEDGTFTLRHVAPLVKSIAANDGSTFGTAPVGDKDVVVRLEAGRSITGTVRDGEKRPVGGVEVSAYRNGEMESGTAGTAITDDKGRYEINDCGASDYGLYAIATSDLVFSPWEVTLRSARSARIDFNATVVPYLRGVVLDERKRPVAGATVQWVIGEMPILYGYLGKDETVSTKSGADGRFRLPFPTDDLRLSKSDVRLQALQSSHAVGVTEPLKTGTRLVTITLHDGIALSGVVSDSDGHPVNGAGVVLIQDPWGAAPLPMESTLASNILRPFAVSDSEGKFTLHLNGTAHDLSVWKAGLAGFHQGNLTPKPGDAPMRIVLERGVEIRGRVIRKGSSAPVEGAVTAQGEDSSFATANLADDGTFVLSGLRAAGYSVAFGNTGGNKIERLVKAPAADVVLELPPVGEVRGRVVDKFTGRPIADGEVSTNANQFETQKSDAGGAFAMEVSAGPVTIIVRAEGYVGESKAVEVEVGKTAEITVAMSSGRTISGRVTSESGVPVKHASVSLNGDAATWRERRSEESGEFELSGLPRERLTLNVEASLFVKRTIDVEPGNLDARVDIVLSRGRKAAGRVITNGGAGVEGAMVWLSGPDSQVTRTGPDGTFVIEGLSGDRYSIRATHDDFGSAEREGVDISSEVVMTLQANEGSGSVHGTVAGFKDSGWLYGAVSASPGGASAPIGRDGTYRLTRVPAGEVELQATAMSMRGDASATPAKVTVAPDGDVEADLAFRTDVVIRGVVTEDGRPAAGRKIQFTAPQTSASATTNADGVYQITSIERGSYDVSVSNDVQAFRTLYLVLDSATFDIRIDYSEIHGRVTDETGIPLAGVTIVATAGESPSRLRAETDAAGAFSLRVFRSPYVVSATKSGFAALAQRVEPDSAALMMTMLRSDGLRVRLVDARYGQTLNGYVVATDGSGMKLARTHEAQTDGSILMPLASGAYRISASSYGYATQSVRASIPREDELRVALTPGGTLLVHTDRASRDAVKLVLPSGEEYVPCECTGTAEIGLTGTTTTIENVAPGAYTLQVLDERGRIKTSYPVTVAEGQATNVEIHVPE